jgi:hypothetical protein
VNALLTSQNARMLLQRIPADERGIWVKVGGILKDAFGSEGFSLWDDWSQSSDRYSARDAQVVWRSLGNNEKRAGLGTLVFLARQSGWTAGNELTTPPTAPRHPRPPTRDTGAYAATIWVRSQRGDSFVGTHRYSVSKGIGWAAGARRGYADGTVIGRDADCLLIPIRTEGVGKLQGVQAINSDGKKQTFGKITGGTLLIGNSYDLGLPWYVTEGWASAVSVVFHHHNGAAVCGVAFGKQNLISTAEMLARIFAPPEVVVLQEQDG